jgi:hypothetical protein
MPIRPTPCNRRNQHNRITDNVRCCDANTNANTYTYTYTDYHSDSDANAHAATYSPTCGRC